MDEDFAGDSWPTADEGQTVSYIYDFRKVWIGVGALTELYETDRETREAALQLEGEKGLVQRLAGGQQTDGDDEVIAKIVRGVLGVTGSGHQRVFGAIAAFIDEIVPNCPAYSLYQLFDMDHFNRGDVLLNRARARLARANQWTNATMYIWDASLRRLRTQRRLDLVGRLGRGFDRFQGHGYTNKEGDYVFLEDVFEEVVRKK